MTFTFFFTLFYFYAISTFLKEKIAVFILGKIEVKE